MSVLLTQRGGKCPSGPGWNTGTKGFCKLYLVCESACLCRSEQLSLCYSLHNYSQSQFSACSLLNVLIMCYSIFTILMGVTIEMQMSKGCLEWIQIPLHYTGFLNHLVWICIWTPVLYFVGVIFCRTKAAVCAHYSFSVAFLDTHEFIWRQTDWQNRFHLRNMQTQKSSFCVLLFFLSLSHCLFSFFPVSYFKGGGGSRTVCYIMALTASDINAVCFDPIVSGNFYLRPSSEI